jgi:hypothetical protein
MSEELSSLSPERRGVLLQGKVAALVRGHFGVETVTRTAFPGGAACSHELTGWVLVEQDPSRALGKAMAWARQQGLTELHVIAPDGAGALARRSALFVDGPTVWWLNETELHAVEPEPLNAPAPVSATGELLDVLRSSGLDVVEEQEHVAGEWRGLEVARVVGDRLEVGVGEADRELTAMLHGDLSPEDALRRVVAIVGEHRRPGARPHPLNQLVPERWLRWSLPDVVPVAAPRPRAGLRERDIACGTRHGTVVVCSVGVDLDLVPAAAEARMAIDPDADLVLVVPDRDDHPVTRALASRLRDAAIVETVSGDWRT